MMNKTCLIGLISLLFLHGASAEEQALSTAGLSPDRLKRLDSVVEREIAEGNVAGAVVLIQRSGELVWLKAYGEADVATHRAMTTNDVFRIASMSKAITSAAVMLLFEEGRLLLDDPVGDYLPSFDKTFEVVVPNADGSGYRLEPANGPVTVRQLLTHTSGISYRFMGLEPLSSIYTDADIHDGLGGDRLPLAEAIAALAEMPLAHQPGEAWTYGLGTDVLGRLVEVVSGRRLDQFLDERLFDPLGMNDTWFEVPAAEQGRLAALHTRSDEGLTVIPDGVRVDGPTVFSADYPYDGETDYLSGGAGLSSTAADYGRFLQMILNGGELDGCRVLSRKTVELMTTNQVGNLDNAGFGAGGFSLGFAVRGGPHAGSIRSAGTLGWSGFFNTLMWADPEEQLIAILMTQHYPYGVELMELFPVMVYQAIDD